MRHVAGAQPEARQEQQDRAIPPALDDFAVACRNQPVHLIRRQISRQVGEPPAGIAGNDIGETRLATAFDSQVAQERTQAGRQLLDRSLAATARAVQEEAANGGRLPSSRILPERRHQVRGVARVEPDRGVGRAAVLAQPLLEVRHQERRGSLQRRGVRLADTDFDQMPAKEPGAENGVVVAATSHRARTSAPAQMLAERRKINIARHRPLPSGDMAKVRRRAQIWDRRGGAIPLPLKRGCESVKVWSARPAPQMPQHLRCREVGLQHIRPRSRSAVGGRSDEVAGPSCYGEQDRCNSQKNPRRQQANSPLRKVPIMKSVFSLASRRTTASGEHCIEIATVS